jgi:hypothetical protein
LTAGTFTLIEIISLRLAEVNKNRSEQGLPKKENAELILGLDRDKRTSLVPSFERVSTFV